MRPVIVIGSAQRNAYIGSIDSYCSCVTAACGMGGGGQIPMVLYVKDNNSGQDRPTPAGQDNINRGNLPGLDRGITPERGMDESDIGC